MEEEELRRDLGWRRGDEELERGLGRRRGEAGLGRGLGRQRGEDKLGLLPHMAQRGWVPLDPIVFLFLSRDLCINIWTYL